MNLREFRRRLPDNRICYIVLKNKSGFDWVGQQKDLPEKYLDVKVLQTGIHVSNYPGLMIDLDMEGDHRKGYWFWWECDESVEPRFTDYTESEPPWLELYARILGDIGREYRLTLREFIEKYHRFTDCFDRAVRKARNIMIDGLELLESTSTGQYAVQRIEDEEKVYMHHPDLRTMDADKRDKLLDKYRKEYVMERSRKQYEATQKMTLKEYMNGRNGKVKKRDRP